jgi:ferredoxin
MKWPVDGEKCFYSWESHGSGCAMCIKVCPFNKPQGMLHDAARLVIGAKSGLVDQSFVKLDDALGYGSPKPTFGFMKSNKYMHIKD